ncbi:hypothetical protein BTA51_27155 [Hahella sp. CCB-MM4]|uniref:hypothetical protein n=1 Tax=Hahella sp. (strain CCB-MM4) TaxID=1926491 RepID=UPI000B9B09A0|nr:hypothetical protein [Hahella sp. CCB-MM4]OZG70156.1 hypothetical protein BTA51_27155 [Hahella sp. CCB-MM4]
MMEWLLLGYLGLLTAYVFWNVIASLFDDEMPGLGEILLLILYPCLILAAGKYMVPGLAERLGGWSTFVTIVVTVGILVWALISYGAILPSDEAEESSDENRDSETDPDDQDLDGDEPIPEDVMAEKGKKIGKLFSPASSTTEKLEALQTIGEASEDSEESEGLTGWERVVILAGFVLFIPAVVLNYLA